MEEDEARENVRPLGNVNRIGEEQDLEVESRVMTLDEALAIAQRWQTSRPWPGLTETRRAMHVFGEFTQLFRVYLEIEEKQVVE